MDSLELPFDLIWEGKPEPLSPADLALANAEDVLIFDKDFADGFGLTNPDFLKSERGDDDAKSRSALAMLLELQQQALAIDNEVDGGGDDDDDTADVAIYGDDIVISDLEADQWLTQSMNFFPLDVYADVAATANHIGGLGGIVGMRSTAAATTITMQPAVKVEQTAQLIREFDSVFEGVELTHLTPPQTPPQSPPRATEPKQTGFIFPSQLNIHALSSNHNIITVNNINTSNITTNNNNYFLFDGAQHSVAASPITQDIAHEMEVVEELVRDRAQNLPDWTDGDDEDDDDYNNISNDDDCTANALLSPPSPSSSSNSSSSSSSSQSSSCGSSPRSESSYGHRDDAIDTIDARPSNSVGVKQQRRPRPYGRSSEDKKSRKKEQNKNAATRYRQKKKAEIEVALDEERELLDVHAGLQVRCADVQREIKYLKSLMRDLYRAKVAA